MSDLIRQSRIRAANAALEYIQENQILGVGSGNTMAIFIERLATIKHKINAAIASSVATQKLLKAANIPVVDFNNIDSLPLYIDSLDAFNNYKQLIKGGGGCLVREKILAVAATKFICLADRAKETSLLGDYPVPVEVIPMARSQVAHALVELGGRPVYRDNFTTDNGNIILDVHDMTINKPIELELAIKQITGVVDCGIFAKRNADVILIGTDSGVESK